MIPKVFKADTTVIKNYTIRAHMICFLVRTLIAILIMNGTLPITGIYILCGFIIIAFGYKYFKFPRVWKVYLRVVYTYMVVLILTLLYKDKYRHVSGAIIICDVLMSLQSRHVFDRLGYL